MTTVHTIPLPTGEKVFYRTAGSTSNPTILLLHGFPSSSHQYRHLITALSDTYHIVAPDLPGFGFTTVPEGYTHSFAALAETVDRFLTALHIRKFAVYIFDYGAPTGLRLALSRPKDVVAIVSQNGNVFEEGLLPFWDRLRKLWAASHGEEAAVRAKLTEDLLTLEATRWQYEFGAPADRVGGIEPEGYTLDQALMERPGNKEIQIDMFRDYENNVTLYPQFQEWMRESKVSTLAVWGANDPIFGREGAVAWGRFGGEVKLFDGGHFLLETHLDEVVAAMKEFLGKVGKW